MEERNEIEINLGSIFKVLKKNLIIILAVVLVFGAAGYILTDMFVTPMYQVKTSGIFDIGTGEVSEDLVNPGSINTSQTFAADFTKILKSSSVLYSVAQELTAMGYDVSYEQLHGMINVSLESEIGSQIINISVMSANKDLALAATNELLEIGAQKATEYISMASFVPFDGPIALNGGNPISPSLSTNAMLAGLIAGVAICCIFIIISIFNDTVKSERDLEQLGINIIAKIPRIQEKKPHTTYVNIKT